MCFIYPVFFNPRKSVGGSRKIFMQSQHNQPCISNSVSRKRLTGGVNGGVITEATLKSLEYKRDYLFPFSLLLQNTRPFGLQVIWIWSVILRFYCQSFLVLRLYILLSQETLQLLISVLILGDFTITLLLLFQFYWISLGAFLAVLLIPPLSLLPPFPAGLNALFSRGPRRSSLARIYALWNVTSISNIVSTPWIIQFSVLFSPHTKMWVHDFWSDIWHMDIAFACCRVLQVIDVQFVSPH